MCRLQWESLEGGCGLFVWGLEGRRLGREVAGGCLPVFATEEEIGLGVNEPAAAAPRGVDGVQPVGRVLGEGEGGSTDSVTPD